MTALGDFTPGDVLTAADLNAIGTWTSYTPSCTWDGYGNFDFVKYARIQNFVTLKFKWDTTTTIGVSYHFEFNLPFTVDDGFAGAVGTATLFDSSSTDYYAELYSGGTTIKATVINLGTVTPTSPFTFTTGDSIRGLATLEI